MCITWSYMFLIIVASHAYPDVASSGVSFTLLLITAVIVITQLGMFLRPGSNIDDVIAMVPLCITAILSDVVVVYILAHSHT